jgi:uncharacterized protein YcaQ
MQSMPGADLSQREARRIVLAAQGFATRRSPAAPGRAALRRMLAHTRLLQMDSVNVLVRAHYLPAFSRLGPYPTETLDRMAWRRPRELFEYWGHEASLLPVALWPLLQWRMQRAGEEAWGRIRSIATERPDFVSRVLEVVRGRGPVRAAEVEAEVTAPGSDGARRRPGPWWDRSDTKNALEWLFWSGQVTSAGRRGFERIYDVPERVLPESVLARPVPSPSDARRALLEIAAGALGVGTEADLRDYFRLRPADAREGLSELVEAGTLREVRVDGWRQPAYLHPEARVPRRVRARALLAPFDPLVWDRARTERVFGMRYRIEIYVPASRRQHGYYVLPFLLGEDLVARVDLKADRQAGRLRVLATHAEDGRPHEPIAAELRAELSELAGWLGLDAVEVHPAGDLGPALRAAATTKEAPWNGNREASPGS